jgi:hypothetical protein
MLQLSGAVYPHGLALKIITPFQKKINTDARMQGNSPWLILFFLCISRRDDVAVTKAPESDKSHRK